MIAFSMTAWQGVARIRHDRDAPGPDQAGRVDVRSGGTSYGPVPVHRGEIADGTPGSLSSDTAGRYTRLTANATGAVLRRTLRDAGCRGPLTWDEQPEHHDACQDRRHWQTTVVIGTVRNLSPVAWTRVTGWLTTYLTGTGWNVVTTGSAAPSGFTVHARARSAAAPGNPAGPPPAYDISTGSGPHGLRMRIDGPCIPLGKP